MYLFVQAGGETLSEDTQTLLLQVGRADLIAYSDVLRLGQSCSQSLSGRSFFFFIAAREPSQLFICRHKGNLVL